MASIVFKTMYWFLALVVIPQALAAPGGAHAHQIRSTTSPLKDAALAGHNDFRAQHGASPLAWSDKLADAAQSWASRCNWGHSQGAVGPYGENLAAGGGDFTVTDAINLWTAEVKDYDPQHPTYSHFTQVVWKATTEVGCAVATCSGKMLGWGDIPIQYFVCEYNPYGNVDGQYDQNVQV